MTLLTSGCLGLLTVDSVLFVLSSVSRSEAARAVLRTDPRVRVMPHLGQVMTMIGRR